jgi:energy-converting hydrogenase B subunit N
VEDEIVRDAEMTVGVNHRGVSGSWKLTSGKSNSLTEKISGICFNIHIWNSCRVGEIALG